MSNAYASRTGAVLCAFVLSLLAGCGSTSSEPQRASDSQMALAATVAAAPVAVAPTQLLPTQAATNAPTQVPATAAPLGSTPDTAGTSTQATALVAAAGTEIAAATASVVPTAAATSAPTKAPIAAATLAPTEAPTQVPPTAAPPTAAPTQAPPVIACDSPCSISFSELYSGATITGPILSDKAKALSGKQVIMRGFMAPPLSPSTTFFVLTKDPMVYCPFCNTAADWPFDIVYIKMSGGRNIPTMVPTTNIAIVGRFEVGSWSDPETGFVSLIRVFADSVQPIS